MTNSASAVGTIINSFCYNLRVQGHSDSCHKLIEGRSGRDALFAFLSGITSNKFFSGSAIKNKVHSHNNLIEGRPNNERRNSPSVKFVWIGGSSPVSEELQGEADNEKFIKKIKKLLNEKCEAFKKTNDEYEKEIIEYDIDLLKLFDKYLQEIVEKYPEIDLRIMDGYFVHGDSPDYRHSLNLIEKTLKILIEFGKPLALKLKLNINQLHNFFAENTMSGHHEIKFAFPIEKTKSFISFLNEFEKETNNISEDTLKGKFKEFLLFNTSQFRTTNYKKSTDNHLKHLFSPLLNKDKPSQSTNQYESLKSGCENEETKLRENDISTIEVSDYLHHMSEISDGFSICFPKTELQKLCPEDCKDFNKIAKFVSYGKLVTEALDRYLFNKYYQNLNGGVGSLRRSSDDVPDDDFKSDNSVYGPHQKRYKQDRTLIRSLDTVFENLEALAKIFPQLNPIYMLEYCNNLKKYDNFEATLEVFCKFFIKHGQAILNVFPGLDPTTLVEHTLGQVYRLAASAEVSWRDGYHFVEKASELDERVGIFLSEEVRSFVMEEQFSLEQHLDFFRLLFLKESDRDKRNFKSIAPSGIVSLLRTIKKDYGLSPAKAMPFFMTRRGFQRLSFIEEMQEQVEQAIQVKR